MWNYKIPNHHLFVYFYHSLGWKSKSYPMGCTSHDCLWDIVKTRIGLCTHSSANNWWAVCCYVFNDHCCWFIQFTICWFEFNKKSICARILYFLWSCKLYSTKMMYVSYKVTYYHSRSTKIVAIFRQFQSGQKKTLIVMALSRPH